jgi:hypothetical protein
MQYGVASNICHKPAAPMGQKVGCVQELEKLGGAARRVTRAGRARSSCANRRGVARTSARAKVALTGMTLE